MIKIESGNKFLTSIKGHNSGLYWQNLPIFNPKPLLPNINSYTKFEENRSKNAQDRELKRILTSIKGHNSGLNWLNLPIFNPKSLLLSINSYTKFEENRSKNDQDRELKQIFNVNQGP